MDRVEAKAMALWALQNLPAGALILAKGPMKLPFREAIDETEGADASRIDFNSYGQEGSHPYTIVVQMDLKAFKLLIEQKANAVAEPLQAIIDKSAAAAKKTDAKEEAEAKAEEKANVAADARRIRKERQTVGTPGYTPEEGDKPVQPFHPMPEPSENAPHADAKPTDKAEHAGTPNAGHPAAPSAPATAPHRISLSMENTQDPVQQAEKK